MGESVSPREYSFLPALQRYWAGILNSRGRGPSDKEQKVVPEPQVTGLLAKDRPCGDTGMPSVYTYICFIYLPPCGHRLLNNFVFLGTLGE